MHFDADPDTQVLRYVKPISAEASGPKSKYTLRRPSFLNLSTHKTITMMMCLLHGIGNGNKTHVYLAKCNLGMRIKCVGPIQFENKEYESYSHWGVGNENEGMRMKYMFPFVSL